jgi:acyl-CoA synthetase (NDP forming)
VGGPTASDPAAQLTPLWAARAVAVVGASSTSGSPGRLAVDYLLRYGFPGPVVPVHPSASAVAGQPAYPSVTAAVRGTGVPIDLALIVVPVPAVAGAVDDCVAAGVPVVIVGTSGFGEVDAAGRAAQAALVARARAAGTRVVGPNCIGAANLWTGQIASFSPLFSSPDTVLTPGGLGFASTSGALGYGTASLALERGLGLGWIVTTGNEADVSTVEVMAALAAEPDCTAVLGYVEGLSDRPALNRLAASGKPAAILVAGSSPAGAQAAALHTGALATPARVTRAALRNAGVVQVSDVEELLDVGDAFALAATTGRWPRGPRVAVLTTSGGSGILAADAIAAHGLTLAQLSQSTVATLTGVVPSYGSVANPVDVTATVMRDRTLMARAVATLAADDAVDLIVACFCVLVGADVNAIVTALGDVARDTGTPVLVARTGAAHLAPQAGAALRAAGLPTFPTPARAVRAASALCQAADARVRRAAATSTCDGRSRRTTVPCGPVPPPAPTEADLKAMLAAAGIRVPAGRVVTDPAAATAAVAECGGHAVLKVVAPHLTHKTEVGGVVLDVPADRAEAVAAMLLALPGVTGVLVEERVPDGVEVLVGVAPSPLGPTITVGVGGVLAETLDDVAVRLLPVDRDDVLDMLGETRLARLLAGVRGRPPADTEALVAVVLAVAGLAAGWPEQSTLDLNPVSVGPSGAVVLDAVYRATATIGEPED